MMYRDDWDRLKRISHIELTTHGGATVYRHKIEKRSDGFWYMVCHAFHSYGGGYHHRCGCRRTWAEMREVYDSHVKDFH